MRLVWKAEIRCAACGCIWGRVVGMVRKCRFAAIGELEQRHFLVMHINWTLRILGKCFGPNFGQIVSITVKRLRSTNLVLSRHYTEKGLTSDWRTSLKNPFLKFLTNMYISTTWRRMWHTTFFCWTCFVSIFFVPFSQRHQLLKVIWSLGQPHWKDGKCGFKVFFPQLFDFVFATVLCAVCPLVSICGMLYRTANMVTTWGKLVFVDF